MYDNLVCTSGASERRERFAGPKPLGNIHTQTADSGRRGLLYRGGGVYCHRDPAAVPARYTRFRARSRPQPWRVRTSQTWPVPVRSRS